MTSLSETEPPSTLSVSSTPRGRDRPGSITLRTNVDMTTSSSANQDSFRSGCLNGGLPPTSTATTTPVSDRTPLRLQSRDVVAAFGALAIPTVATVFASDIADWPGWAKWLTITVWTICAGLLVADTLRRDQKIDQATTAVVQKRERRRNEAIDMALRRIFVGELELPRKWDWTVYLYDSEQGLLVPAWPTPDPADSELFEVKAFAPGQGATGQAFENRQVIVRLGDEVHDDTHGLTEAQQTYFADRNAVVAAPIYADDDHTVIGALAAIADDADDYFDRPKNRQQLEATATVVGTLLEMLPPPS